VDYLFVGDGDVDHADAGVVGGGDVEHGLG
jgi:hypothetical protein